MEKEIVINRLLNLRENLNLTQKNIGDILNVSQAQYNRIEKGINELDYNGLTKIALFYNTSTDYILGLTDEKKPYKRKK